MVNFVEYFGIMVGVTLRSSTAALALALVLVSAFCIGDVKSETAFV